MKQNEQVDRLIGVLKKCQALRPEPAVSARFDENILSQVRVMAAAGDDADEPSLAGMFLRFSFATLLLAVFVHGTYRLSAIESQISVSNIAQLDPFDVSEDFNE